MNRATHVSRMTYAGSWRLNDQSRRTEPKDPRVDAALRDYLERVDRGELVDREQFLSRHAEIADQLRSFIAAEDEVRKLAGAVTPLDRSQDSTKSFVGRGQETVAPQAAKRPAQAGGTELSGNFGRYRIIRALGKGAMGTVYLAQDTHIERQVALKTPHFTEDPTGEQMERFIREARAAGNLRHANICPIHDFGQIDGKHYISMAYIEGRPLSAFIKPDKPQTERQILIVIRKLALALQEAHDHEIVHRDLKPANIMVDTKGEPIIMDFGLARQARRGDDIRLTQTGNIIGTPAYMSPEQVEGEPDKIGPPTDQYSLGVILYELLTSQLPFKGTIVGVMGQILTKEVRHPSKLRPDLDPRIEAVCMKLMAKTPAGRFASLKAAADELATILKSPAAKATPTQDKLTSSPAPLPTGDRLRADAGASQMRKSLKPKAVTESDLASLEELARKCYSRRDFDQVIQVIERIPEDRRNAALETLLEKARGKADEIAFLICEIDEAERLTDAQTALKKADALLTVKPGHHRALEMQEKYSGYGEGGAVRIGVLDQFRRPLNDGGWIPWSVLALGLAVFGVMTGVMVIYLNRTAVVIDIQDPGVEVAVKGTTLTVTGPDQQSVKVTPGDQKLTITCNGLETITPSFTIKKGEKRTVTVSILDSKLVAWLDNEILPLTPVHGDKASNSPNVGIQEVVKISPAKKKPADPTQGTPDVDSKPNIAAAPLTFFRPFLVRGEWRIASDELIQPTLATTFGGDNDVLQLLAFGEEALSNYDLTLEVKKTGGRDATGIFFHWLGPGHYRRFDLERNSAVNSSYVYDGIRNEGDRKGLDYSSNRWNSLKVEVRGDTFRAYLDGVLQFEPSADARFTHGRICLFTDAATARFRRIKVTDPNGKALFEGLPELPSPSNNTTPRDNLGKSSRPVTAGETAAKTSQKQWAERLKTPVVSTNSLGMKLVLIPPGEFQMGSPKSEGWRQDQEQQHRIRITKPFYLGVYEVTQSEFERVTGRNPSFFSNSGGQAEAATGVDTSRYPAEQVSWYDAVEFCNKLSEKEGRRPYYEIVDVEREADGGIKKAKVSIEGGAGYRLPTEAQWEYACRAGTTTPFNFGTANNGAESNCLGNGPYGTEEKGPALGRTVPVGSYRPNAYGLYDMHGNVLEWCWDLYDSNYYKYSPKSDPPGALTGSERVFRGGHWGPYAAYCRSAFRDKHSPELRVFIVGFRVACDATGGKQFKPPNDASASAADRDSRTATDPDRTAAEWVLSIGGTIKINETRELKTADELPKESFELTEVRLDGNPKVSDAGLASFKNCKNVKVLILWGANVSDAGLAHLSECKNLTTIDLNGNPKVTDAGLAYFGNCKDLRSLALGGATRVTDAGLAHIKDFRNVTCLNLWGTQVSDAGLIHFKNCKDLTFLNLSGTKVTNAGLAYFKDSKDLTSLTLGNRQLTDDGLAYFKDCKNLTGLDLSGSPKVTDAGLAYFKNCTNLNWLILWGTQVSDDGLAYFGDCKLLTSLLLSVTRVTNAGLAHFKDCKLLEKLDLNNTQVTDAGLAHFTDCKNLNELNLWGTQVTDAVLKRVAGFPKLSSLFVKKTNVTRAGVKKLAAALPRCKIDWNGGVIGPWADAADAF
jgi:formylglycine-generating enzyme required for sulfatase activity/serine/threonine protein kinase